MWYTRIIDGRNFLFFHDLNTSIFIDCEEKEHMYYQMYLTWVADGNNAEEWNPDAN